ncbi:uncharacterized protein LOC129757269 [Uranotaenia lowii]|uniref:uncharacterized protein LOC129757269 n=1 Tax=Uranotaenia lowii TaxID=190385 RepID=UPI002479F5E6|nr:uncharacterized protein LOC129757269 [Uranotaenia lowii]
MKFGHSPTPPSPSMTTAWIGTPLNNVIIPSSGPLLMAFDLDDSQMYYVFANQARLTEGTNDAKQAICDLVMVHYVHNFMYMKEGSKFMEFIQQYFFKIIPQSGSKSQAVRVLKQQRLVKRLIDNLTDHMTR